VADNEHGHLVRLRSTGQTILDPKDDLRRRTVTDVGGEEVGQITALIVDDKERKVRFLQVASGGFLGFGRRTTFIPVETIRDISPIVVHIDRTGQHVASAPTYDPEFIDDLALFAHIYGHYDLAPYWGAHPPDGVTKITPPDRG
jgi:sporulation protein YlmC with PRC-barrel domain